MMGRDRGFSRGELSGIQAVVRERGTPRCPSCSVPLLSRRIPPRDDVAYVRHRLWLLCPECGRSALVEAAAAKRHAPPGVTGDPEQRHGDPRKRTGDPGEPPGASPLPHVGWREWVGLPSLGIHRIKAKVDTGARSSSLHVTELEEFEEGGRPWVRFTVHPIQKSGREARQVRAPLTDRRSVRPSSGAAETRPVVVVDVQIGALRFPCEVTLARRDRMGFRMLLGRTALRGRFLVDPGRSYLQRLPGAAAGSAGEASSPDPGPHPGKASR
jgi:hypothetical protein